MFGLRLPELLVILIVLLLLFGTKKLPQLGDSLGKGIRAFKKAVDHGLDESDGGDASKGRQGDGPTAGSTAADPQKAGRGGDRPA